MVSSKTDVSYSPTEPLKIVESKSSVFFFSGDVGITTATGVSAWADQSGNARNASQGTAGSQPAYNALGLNNKGTLTFDGTDDYITIAYIPPAPATTPSWYWCVFKELTSVNGATIFASNNTNRHRFYRAGTAMSMSCGLGVNSSAITAGSWFRAEVFFNNSTTDYRKVGSSSITGEDAGNNVGSTAITLGAINNTPSSPCNVEVAAFGCWAGEPTAAEKTALDMWILRYYGGTVVI